MGLKKFTQIIYWTVIITVLQMIECNITVEPCLRFRLFMWIEVFTTTSRQAVRIWDVTGETSLKAPQNVIRRPKLTITRALWDLLDLFCCRKWHFRDFRGVLGHDYSTLKSLHVLLLKAELLLESITVWCYLI